MKQNRSQSMFRFMRRCLIGTILFAGALNGEVAQAQTKNVRISYQFGLPYLPIFVALDHKLIEKQAATMGIRDVHTSGVELGGTSITNDALLSGSVELAVAGMGGVLQMWDKTKGDVKGVMSINSTALLLVTNDPRVRSIKDYVGISDHKIALPAVKVSAHAIILEMAAEKQLGEGKQFSLDGLTVSLPHPSAYTALMGGGSEVRSHFANLPFSFFELKAKEKEMHLVLSSYDVLGGPHSNVVLYAMKTWVTENPELLKAIFNAMVEADNWVNANPGDAAELFKRYTNSKFEVNDIRTMIENKAENEFTPDPQATLKFADFMYRVGQIKTKPSSWKDYFWDVAHQLNGS